MPFLAKEESRMTKNPTTALGLLYGMLVTQKQKTVKRAVWERAIAKSDRVSTSRIAEHKKESHETAVMNRIYTAKHFFAEVGLILDYDVDTKTFSIGRGKPEVQKTKKTTKVAKTRKVKKVKVARKTTTTKKSEPVVVGEADSDDSEV